MRSTSRTLRLALCAVLVAAAPLHATSLEDYLPAGVSYDPAIPKPAEVLGFEVGAWHARPDQILRYAEAIAATSERAVLEIQGHTLETRPQPLVVFTSAENHAGLEEIRQRHLRLSDPAAAAPSNAELAAMPVVVYLGYSIHGNEPSGANAALLVLYHLAAARTDEVEQLLARTVVLVDPSLNPDGLARFAHWANMHRGQVLVGDPNHREHLEAWPGGRTNHYWFDLNRDWLLLQQPESRHRVATLQRWRPNLVGDLHEMGSSSTFFFQPGVPERKHPLIPEGNVELTAAVSIFHAARLDAKRRLYYTREGYDDFYPGKTAAYPDFNGGVAFLFEQASARGHVQETDNGLLTFPFAIENQFLASLGMLDGARDRHDDLLRYQSEFYRSALEEARVREHAAWLFGAPDDEARAGAFEDVLLQHGIEVYRLAETVRVGDRTFAPPWARIVPLAQAQYRLLEVIFERRTTFADPIFYDVSTWTLPLAFGLHDAPLDGGRFRSELLGERRKAVAATAGRFVESEGQPFAHLFRWQGYYAPRTLAKLLAAGASARVAVKPFTAETGEGRVRFSAGAIVVPAGLQRADVDVGALLRHATVEDGLDVWATASGLTPEGIDLGSPSLEPLADPSLLLVVGEGVSAYEAGAAWSMLDRRFGIAVSLVTADRLTRAELDRYTHVVLVHGRYGELDEQAERLRRWVEEGGTLIAIKGGARWAQESILHRPLEEEDDDAAPPATAPVPADERVAYADYETERAQREIPGTIVEIELDLTHPLAFGYSDPTLPVLRNSTLVLPASENPFENVAHYGDEPLLSGFLGAENAARLAGLPAVLASRLGEGTVVQLLDDPNFRAYWYGTSKLFLNAVFFGPVIESTSLQDEPR
jgi:hypothetical protein